MWKTIYIAHTEEQAAYGKWFFGAAQKLWRQA